MNREHIKLVRDVLTRTVNRQHVDPQEYGLALLACDEALATQPAPTEPGPIRGQSKGFCNWCNLDPAEHARLGCVHPWEQPAETAPQGAPFGTKVYKAAQSAARALSGDAEPQGAHDPSRCGCYKTGGYCAACHAALSTHSGEVVNGS